MPETMTWDFGLEENGQYCKKKWRWLLKIPEVCAEGAKTLPPLRSERPTVKWKEMVAKHISEDIYFPAKPDWQPIQLTLYDLKKDKHPVFEWLREIYKPCIGVLAEPLSADFIKAEANLELYDGCGKMIEKWVYEDIWPQSMDFQDLDMGSSEIMLCDLTLRYARACIVEG